jgi:hypothetical protein
MFTPENELERSLIKASTDPAERPRFYQVLAAANVFVITPGVVPAEAEATTLAPGTLLNLSMIEFGGKSCIAFFSSLTRLQAILQSEVGYIQTNALALLKITKDTPLVLNPGSEYGKEFTPEEVASIVNGTVGQTTVHTTERPTEVLLGQPKDYPQEMVDTLIRLFRGLPEVERAYLAQIHDTAQATPPHALIGIAVSSDWDKVLAQTGLVAQQVSFPNPPLDIIRIGSGESLDSYLLTTKPFYQRAWLSHIFGGKR